MTLLTRLPNELWLARAFFYGGNLGHEARISKHNSNENVAII